MALPKPPPNVERLEGEVEHIVFSGDETGYTVCRLHAPAHRDLVTAVGAMPGIQPGERLSLEGRWLQHPRFGLQFQVSRYTPRLPASANAIKRYLSSSLVRGIGPVMALRLVDAFGEATLDIIERTPERLTEVRGIGPKRAGGIRAAWEAQREVREVMLFLQGHGVSSAYATRIYKAYGQAAIAVVKENPYRLAQDIRGIGFKTADKIAQEIGIDPMSPFRAQAALEHTLLQMADEGHVYAPQEELKAKCIEIVDLPEALLGEALGQLSESGRAVRESEAVYLKGLHQAERGVADMLRSLLSAPRQLRAFDAGAAVAWAEARVGLEFTKSQRRAVAMAVTEKVSVITGGPGTGKTTILRAVLSVLDALMLRVVLAAPTGRASKKLAEAAGHDAKTIHRLLEYKPGEGRFAHDQDSPLKADVVVVDETSMVDTVLMYHLLRALPPHASLLLVGDADQLPSVGPGNVLMDILGSGAVPSMRLTDIFRQGERSQIVVQAHRINQGLMPRWPVDRREQSDFYVVRVDDADRAAETIEALVARHIPQRFGLDPAKDIQVLCPMNRGSAGAAALNERLQKALNPSTVAVTRFGHTFHPGDRVLQTVNDYEKDVFNGDLGWVVGLDPDGGRMVVDYDGTRVEYQFSELDELMPAYAISVHRSQGSEYPAVVVPVLTQHYPMLRRNLLYTAVTRARKLAVLVGNPRAIAIAVKSGTGSERHTGLARRLRELLQPLPG